MISSGATTVTFLLLAGIVPGSRNCRHVIDEIHAIRSPSSVSGFRFNFTMRLPAGNFLQVLKSFSPISWFAPGHARRRRRRRRAARRRRPQWTATAPPPVVGAAPGNSGAPAGVPGVGGVPGVSVSLG